MLFHRHSAWELAEGLEVHSGIKTLVGVSVMISLVPECQEAEAFNVRVM